MAGLRNLERLQNGLSIHFQLSENVVNLIRIGGRVELEAQLDDALAEVKIALLNEFLDRKPE